METTAPEIQPLPRHFHALVSTQLKAMAWITPSGEDALFDKNVDSATLLVSFNSGTTWAYKDVPRQKAVDLMGALSAGKFFGRYIKGDDEFGEPYHRAVRYADKPLPLDAELPAVVWA